MSSKFWILETKSGRRFVFTAHDTLMPSSSYQIPRTSSCSLRKVDAPRYVGSGSNVGINVTSYVTPKFDIKLPAVESHAREAALNVGTGVKEGARTNAETAKFCSRMFVYLVVMTIQSYHVGKHEIWKSRSLDAWCELPEHSRGADTKSRWSAGNLRTPSSANQSAAES
jgi:hypothetical protein